MLSKCKLRESSKHHYLLDARETGHIVVAHDKNTFNGAKIYSSLVCGRTDIGHKCDFRQLAAGLAEDTGTKYEIIRDEKPIRLFIDFEYPRNQRPANSVDDNGKAVLGRLLDKYLPEFLGGKCKPKYIVYDSCRANKVSYHIIFPLVICSSIKRHLKIFVGRFVTWLFENHHDDNELFFRKKNDEETSVIDVCVYRQNGLFRMQNQYKLNDPAKTKLVYREDIDVQKSPPTRRSLANALRISCQNAISYYRRRLLG